MKSSKLQTVIDLQKAGYVEDAAGQRGTKGFGPLCETPSPREGPSVPPRVNA